MNKFDKAHFDWLYNEVLLVEGVPAVWVGGDRHCGDYPNLVSGMPGYYIFSEEKYGSMFYPAIWKYRYGVYAAEQNVHLTAFGVQPSAP